MGCFKRFCSIGLSDRPWVYFLVTVSNAHQKRPTPLQGLIDEVVDVLDERVKALARLVPIPKLSDRAQMRLDKEAALQV